MTAQARRLRNGLLRPWACDWWDGVQEQAHLREQGLDLDLDPFELHALGVAVAEQRGEGHAPAPDLTLSDEASKALDAIVAARSRPPSPGHGQALDQAHDRDQGQRLTPRNSQARRSGHDLDSGLDAGQGDHTSGTVQGNRVRNEKNDRPAIRDYPDEEWN